MTSGEQEWAERIRGWRESGLSAEAFSNGRDFTVSGLRYWAQRLKKGARGGGAGSRVRLARVERVTGSSASLTIEIGAARLSVPSGADMGTLRGTIRALVEAVRGGAE